MLAFPRAVSPEFGAKISGFANSLLITDCGNQDQW
jgi:hypothetical protein